MNYEQTVGEIKTAFADSTLSESTKQTIADALVKLTVKTGANVKSENFEAPPEAANLKGVQVVTTGGGDMDFTKAKSDDIKNLTAIVVTDGADTNITIKNNNFSGTVVLGDGDSTVKLQTNKSVTVETGKGDDSVATGTGKDTVVVSSGNDSVNTGGGNDTVGIKAGFEGDAVVDGGKGSNTLTVADSSTVAFDTKGNVVLTTDGSSVTAKNFSAIVLGNNGDNVNTSTSKKALNVTTGTGDDSVSLGSGKDSMTISGGNDSVSTGAGVDIVKLAEGFAGRLTVDGGAGSDKLDLKNVSVSSVKVVGDVVIITTADGGTIESSHIENFVYDTNGEAKGGIKTVGVRTFDNKFVDDAN